MFPLLRPSVGTETEINPTRHPSQKPGIRFSLKGRKRLLCRACQTTVAHTLPMARNIPLHAHTHAQPYICFPHTVFIHVHIQVFMHMQAFQFASHRSTPYAFIGSLYVLMHTLPKRPTSRSDHTLWVPNPAILKATVGKGSKAKEAEGGGWPSAA